MKTKLSVCKDMKYDMVATEDGKTYLTMRLDTEEEMKDAYEKLMTEMGFVNEDDN